MNTISYSDVYFAITSVATIAVSGLIILALFFVLSILRDIKRISKIARKESEFIAKSFSQGVSVFGHELGEETAGFLRTVFSLLLTKAVKAKTRRVKKVV